MRSIDLAIARRREKFRYAYMHEPRQHNKGRSNKRNHTITKVVTHTGREEVCLVAYTGHSGAKSKERKRGPDD